MEHKLITGGSQWLPFARSRIKALRALGLPYVCQKYEIDGVRIEVRIAGEHEYIRLESGSGPFGGVTRDGTLVEIPTSSPVTNYTLRDFKPTKVAIKYTSFTPKPKVPEFHDEDRLGVLVAGHVEPTKQGDSQYKHICGSMYSGRMAQLVQLLLGYGKMATTTPYPNKDEIPILEEESPPYQDILSGVRVRYDHRWARCHGIVVAQDDSIWLVEISQVNGVIAMPLPTMSTDVLLPEIRKLFGDVLEIKELFGGVPSGGTFPADVVKAIEDGKVIRLAPVEALGPLYTKISYSRDMGWTFPDDGRVAYNTCRGTHATELNRYGTAHKKMAYLYRLDITISGGTNPSGSAVLTLQEEAWACTNLGPLNNWDWRDSAWSCPFIFQDSTRDPNASINPDQVVPVDDVSYEDRWTLPGFPIFVRHRLNKVEIVRINGFLGGTYVGASIVSTELKPVRFGYTYTTREYGKAPDRNNDWVYMTRLWSTGHVAHGGVWSFGARDAFATSPLGQVSWYVSSSVTDVPQVNPFGHNGSGTIIEDTFPADVPKPGALEFPGRPKNLAEAYAIAQQSPNNSWIGPIEFLPSYAYLALPTKTIETKEVILNLLEETANQRKLRVTWHGTLNRSFNRLDQFPRFYIRHSVFGPSFHAVYSDDLVIGPVPDYGVQKFIGPLLKDEAPTNLPFYSFVGYLT